MKKVNVISFGLALLVCVAPSAMATGPAQSLGTSLYNSGSVNNAVQTSASVTGGGWSYSSATGAAGITANGSVSGAVNPVCGGTCPALSGEVEVQGNVKVYNEGSAFNVSSGSGLGSASSVGGAQAHIASNATYSGPGQALNLKGTAEGNSALSVVASTSQGGVASAGNLGSFEGTGAVGSKQCVSKTDCGYTVTKDVWGNVSDVKNSVSQAATSGMIVDNVTLSPANTSATANGNVTFSGNFTDPLNHHE